MCFYHFPYFLTPKNHNKYLVILILYFLWYMYTCIEILRYAISTLLVWCPQLHRWYIRSSPGIRRVFTLPFSGWTLFHCFQLNGDGIGCDEWLSGAGWSGDKEDAGWADMSGQIRSRDTDYQSWIFIHFGSRVFAGLLFGLIAVWTADACVALALAHSLGFRFKFRFRFAFAIASAHAATATSICIRIRSGVGHCLPKTATQLSRPVGTTMPACWYGCYMVWYMVRV